MKRIYERVLKNGLRILVYPLKTIPKVSLQLWYDVGSKQEKEGQKGIAHFIEHMIFKGTDKLSESDIGLISTKLSGSCNAFTSQDYTGYLFDVPSQHWKQVLPIFADCMRNCTFKQEHLNSELKAVIQEIKMYNDDYESTLAEQMMTAIFTSHPYHHPIIGYKQDLWNMQRESLLEFYKHNYAPNNATLVVVGNVDPEDVFKEAENVFGSLNSVKNDDKKFSCNVDISSTSVTLFRDISQPLVQFAFFVPGATEKKSHILDCIAWIFCNGRGARLHKILVDDLKIATEVEGFVEDLFDKGLFFIKVVPKNLESIKKIEEIVIQEINSFCSDGLRVGELERAICKAKVDHLGLFEDYQELAYELGTNILATNDTQYLLEYSRYLDDKDIASEIISLFKKYFRPCVMHKGLLLPFPEGEKERWIAQQEKSDKEDEEALYKIKRTSFVESGLYVNSISSQDPHPFIYPKPISHKLDNGMTVLFHNRDGIEMIDVVLDLKAKYFYDPDDKQGLSLFVSRMMLEGTERYTGYELAQEIESRGMSLSIIPGMISMSMLSQDFAFGMELLEDVLSRPKFDKDSIEKIRTQLLSELEQFWDRPTQFIGLHAREHIYKGHPYSKNQLGTAKSIAKISRDDLFEFHKKYVSPQDANIAIVGSLLGHDIICLAEETIGKWAGPKVCDLEFPSLFSPKKQTFNYKINRDQIVLCYVGLSVSRLDEQYDKLLLFDQILTGSTLGSMCSHLFQLREQTGLFYTIGGSVVAGSGKQPGMIGIKTIVSLDQLEKAELLIEKTIDSCAQNMTNQEFIDAKNGLINMLAQNFESNGQTALAFLFIERLGFASDYFDRRAEQLLKINKEAVLEVANKIVNTDSLVKLRAGRL